MQSSWWMKATWRECWERLWRVSSHNQSIQQPYLTARKNQTDGIRTTTKRIPPRAASFIGLEDVGDSVVACWSTSRAEGDLMSRVWRSFKATGVGGEFLITMQFNQILEGGILKGIWLRELASQYEKHGKFLEQKGLKGVQMVQFGCPRHWKPSVSFTIVVGKFPFPIIGVLG